MDLLLLSGDGDGHGHLNANLHSKYQKVAMLDFAEVKFGYTDI